MELVTEAWGPTGDPQRHLSLQELREGLEALPPAPRDDGWLRLICVRHPDGRRSTPEQALLDEEHGLPEDGWTRRRPRKRDAQLAVTQFDVASLIANGQSLTLGGDNLIVELDLAQDNLPVGTRLMVGEAEVVVTPEPHNGCAKYHERFGADALRFVNERPLRHRNLRGIYWRVLRGGAIWRDAPVRVIERAAASS